MFWFLSRTALVSHGEWLTQSVVEANLQCFDYTLRYRRNTSFTRLKANAVQDKSRDQNGDRVRPNSKSAKSRALPLVCVAGLTIRQRFAGFTYKE